MASNEEQRDEEFTARPYQIILYEAAKHQNTIVCLGTGTGKTFIAILLMRDPLFRQQLRGDFRNSDAKRTFFLVPTRPLVKQQAHEIERHFDAKVKGYTGDMNVDFYDASRWTQEMCENEVLVMTPQILLDALNHSFISFERINLLIIDEVHWAAKRKGKKESGHPYKQIMKLYKEVPLNRRPRVLGLSASLINSSLKVELFDDAIKDLEETYCAVCNTSDVAQLCGTHPREVIWNYVSQPSSPSPTAQIVVTALEAFVRFLKTIKGTDDSVPSSVSRIRKCLTNIRNMLSEPVEKTVTDPETKQVFPITITCMGVWCASVAIDKYIDEITPHKDIYANINPNHSKLLGLVIDYLNVIKDHFKPELELDPMAPLTTASPKMHRLLELLRRYKPINGQKSNLCGIIFVDQRSVAKVLADWLNKLKEILPNEYHFLNVSWVVGHSNRPGFESLVTSFTDRQQQEIIKKFRDEELNLIVATSVLEEGLDVRKCNLVIRYDRINTFRQYLQSKGRARAEEAFYYMMSSEEESNKLKAQLESFRVMEIRIENLNKNQRTSGQSVVDNNSDNSDEEEQYMCGDARITTRTAISLLYRYCTKLPSDSFTKLIPIFEVKSYEVMNRFHCSVQLPVNSQLKSPIFGKICKTKKGAKCSAALEACKQLKERGELDDRFLPISKDEFTDKYVEKLGLKIYKSDSNDDQKPGTRTRNQIYSKSFAKVFTRSSDKNSNKYFLHRIAINYPQIDCFRGKYLTFGAITSKPIVNNCSFPVFVNIRGQADNSRGVSSECAVDFIPLNAIEISRDKKSLIEDFHKFTFADVIRLEHINNNLIFEPFESDFNLLVVPLMDKSLIDWNFIERVANFGPIEVKEVSATNRLNFAFNEQTYKDCVFYPWYRIETNGSHIPFYDAIKITEYSAKSKWIDNEYQSFEHYYRCKYNREICNKNQPLIEGRLVKNCAQLVPFTIGKVDPDKREFFPPELVSIHPFPSSLWRQALCLPAILYRLNHMFLSEELRQTIHLETNPKIGSFNANQNYLKLVLNSDITESTVNTPKRIHSTEDLDEGCEGHPFEYGMEDIEEWTVLYPKKKKRNEYQITISSGSRNNAIPVPILGNRTNSLGNTVLNTSESLLRVTNAVINQFSDLIKQCRTRDNGFNSENIDFSQLTYDYSNTSANNLSYGDAFPFTFTGYIEPYIRGKYDATVGDVIPGPTADILLNALTLLNAGDAFNLERLETVGDSFLKFATTGFLYYSCPELDEGRLTYLRQMQICNCNLYYIGHERHISELLVSNKWVPKQNWLPPSYQITEENEMILLTDEKKTTGAFKHHLINDKSIADSIEALIGAHLVIGGNKSALIFMEWLGLKVTPNGHQIDYFNRERCKESEIFRWLPEPKTPIWDSDVSEREIQDFLLNDYNGCNLDHFEDIIGYKFRNKAFLIEAFTHSTYYVNRRTDCYQRLEFLGDSVLDYVITRHIYSDPTKKFSPGELTDLRSALVNNAFFASIAVKFNFHKYLKVLSPDLFRAIENFVKNFEYNKVLAINECFNSLTDEECCDLEETEVPKALGDIFESVAGAVFLDNGLSLDAFWKVYFKLLKPEIDYFSEYVPKMPVRELRERFNKIEFSDSMQISGRKIRVVVTVNGKEYAGVGKNRKFAKIAASKNALRSLKKTKN